MRLNRFLAAAGIGSRRKCDELIATGRVTINGRVCTNFSAQPDERDHVMRDMRAAGLNIVDGRAGERIAADLVQALVQLRSSTGAAVTAR